MKNGKFRTTAAATLLAFGFAQSAFAIETRPCLEKAEVRGLLSYFAPVALDNLDKACTRQLPASSYLRTNLPRLAESFAARRDAAWPQARIAFFKIGAPGKGDGDLRTLSDKALRAIFDDVMAKEMSFEIKPRDCQDVNDVIETLDPLNADQVLEIATTVMSIAGRSGKGFNTCPRRS